MRSRAPVTDKESPSYFSFDDKDFKIKVDEYINTMETQYIILGMRQAMLQLLNDCVMEMPTVPHKTGFLRSSASIWTNQELVKDTNDSGTGTPASVAPDLPAEAQKGKSFCVGSISFNTPYAAHLHELIDANWSEPGAGAKFLEKKLIGNQTRYIKIIAKNLETKREGY